MPAGNVEELILRIIGDSVSGEEALQRVSKAWGQLGVQLQRKRAEIEQAGAGIERTSQEAGNALNGLGNRLQDLSGQLEQAGRAGRFLGATFGAVAAGGGALIQATSRVAMRNEVLALSLYTVGENAGFGRQELDAMVEQVRDLGITTSQARLGLTRMMQGQLSLAQATDIARASQNLAVIAGENSSETYGNIMESVLALQPRLLRQYGIVTTLDQALGDLANSNDVVAQRNQFLNFVLEEAARSAGVYENAMGVVGKRITSIPRLIEEAKNALGKHFLPIIGVGVDALSRLLKMFEALPEGVQRMIAFLVMGGTALAGLVAIVGGLLAVLPMVASGLSAVVGALSSVASFVAPLLPILAALAAAMAGLVAVGGVLAAAWKADWGGIRTAVEEAWGKIQAIINELRPLISGWVTRIRTELRKIATLISGFVTSYLEPVFGRISDLIRSIDWADMLVTFSDAINVVGGYITALLETIKRLLSGQGLRSFMPLRDAAIDVLTLIALTWDKYISKALTWGYNLIVQAANGIISAAQTVMVAAMRFVGNLIGNFLAPGSPPKEGPLSKILKWGQGLINTYLQGFKLADFQILRDALSPIRDVMESALAAGDLSESGFVSMFGRVREQVAALIAGFRETGEISEEALAGIAKTLGAGSKELVKYLRLQLEHQRVLDNLREIQEEYAEAEESGFVSAALKDKLRNAEDAAAAAEEEVNWQRELLSVQQESVDIQLRLVNALEKVADAMEDASGGGGGGGTLGLADTGLGGLGDGLGGVRADLGVMSEDFLTMRKRVEGWVSAFQDWLALPFDQKMKKLATWLTDITGIDFKKIWKDIQDAIDLIDERGLVGALKIWLQSGLDYVEENAPGWAKKLGNLVLSVLVSAAENLLSVAGESAEGLEQWLSAVIEDLMDWMSQNEDGWGDQMAFYIGAAMGRLLALLTVDIPTWRNKLSTWLGKIIIGFLAWLLTEAPFIGKRLFENFLVAVADWVSRLREAIPELKEDLLEWVSLLITKFAEGFAQEAPEWMGDLQHVGAAIVDKIKQGISDTWGGLVDWFRIRLGDLANQLPFSEPKDPASPLRGLAASGRAIANNLAAGIDFSPVRSALTMELARTQRMLAASGAGGFGQVSLSQEFGDIVFPNVRDERDAGFVRRGLERNALQAVMKSRTAGG